MSYDMSLSIVVVRVDYGPVTIEGQTLTVDSSAVRFTSPTTLAAGQRIEFLITLSTSRRIQCLGHVRDCFRTSDSRFQTLASIERYYFERHTWDGELASTS